MSQEFLINRSIGSLHSYFLHTTAPHSLANANHKLLEGILPAVHLDHPDPRDHLVHDLHTSVRVLGRSVPTGVSETVTIHDTS